MKRGLRCTSTWTSQGAEEEDGDVHVAVVGPDELVGAALKWQIVLTGTIHR
jgi:hypothetical protein